MNFSVEAEALEILRQGGWSEQRAVDVNHIVLSLVQAGYVVDERMAAVLSSLSGLTLHPISMDPESFHNDEPLIIDPLGIGVRHRNEALQLEARLGEQFCPLGWWLCGSHVYVGSAGTVIASLPGVVWLLGDNLDDAMNLMLLGNGPLVRIVSEDGLDS